MPDKHDGLRLETKLLFREPSMAERLSEILVSSRSIFGYPCIPSEEIHKYRDTYLGFLGENPGKPVPVRRLRQYSNGAKIFQEKKCERRVGNEWVYCIHEDRTGRHGKHGGAAHEQDPILIIDVERKWTTIKSLGGDIDVCVDKCLYRTPKGEEISSGFEVEAKAAMSCRTLAPVVDYLRAAFGLIPASRSKLSRGLALLQGMSGPPKKVILDMDPGVDDAIAILLALASPELDVLAITTVAGNVNIDQTTRNARLVVDKAKEFYRMKRVPIVARGLTPEGELRNASDVHGQDGLGGFLSSKIKPATSLWENGNAADLMAELLTEFKDEITVICTGPLTNIADCVERYPFALASAKALISMGGVFFQEGNRSPSAEFNIHRDAPSAAKVLEFSRRRRSPRGGVLLPLTFVGLDVTHRVRLFESDLERKGAPAKFVKAVSQKYMAFYEDNEGLPGCYMHDPLAVAFALDPSLCDVEPFWVEVETKGEHTAGRTIADSRPTRLFGNEDLRVTDVCMTVDADRARTLVLERVLGKRKR